ncbi:MAG: AMP-binding protein [Chitinophagales bacterium]
MFTIPFDKLVDDEVVNIARQNMAIENPSWKQTIWQLIADWYNPSVTHIEVHTSGSTGTPKAIKHSKKAMINSAMATCRYLQLTPGNTALLCLPAGKIGGIMMIVRSIVNRMQLVCIEPSTNPIAALPDDVKIDFAALTPMQLYPVQNSYELFRKAEKIECIILGGSEIPAGLTASIQKMANRVYATYGMTETISHIALKRLNGKAAEQYYSVLDGIEMSVNEQDCLLINAPALEVDKLQTKDVVRLYEGKQLDWLGRLDNVINTGGLKVYPEQLEETMRGQMLVPFFIAGEPDEKTGQRVVLVIEKEVITEKEFKLLTDYLHTIQPHIRPRELLLVPRFVKTANGKLKRRETLQAVESRIPL